MKTNKEQKKIFKKLAKQEIKKRNKPKDYLDNIPEPRVIQLCEYCDLEATTLFHDFLGNEIFVCKKCSGEKIEEHKQNIKKFRKAYRIKMEKFLEDYEINRQKFMSNGK